MPVGIVAVPVQPYSGKGKKARGYYNGAPGRGAGMLQHGRRKKKRSVKRQLQPHYTHYVQGRCLQRGYFLLRFGNALAVINLAYKYNLPYVYGYAYGCNKRYHAHRY